MFWHSQKIALFLTQGAFGKAVASMLADDNDIVTEIDGPVYAADLPYADFIIPITVESAHQIRDCIDSVSFVRGIPHVGLEISHKHIVCGPLVIPGSTACYKCYRHRVEQHGGYLAEDKLPEGFASYHVSIAAGFLRSAIKEADCNTNNLGGTVRTFNLINGHFQQSSTVAVNRCERCSKRFREKPLPALSSL
ncbi:hypothetical protein [Rothia sp. 88186D007BW]